MDQDEWLGPLKYATKAAQDKVSVDTLMLRYRPIAPKPTASNPCGVGDQNNNYGLSKRTKRKYVRVSKNSKDTCRGKNRSELLSEDREHSHVVTLQLLPEKSDLSGEYTPDSLNQETQDNGGVTAEVETFVTVECITGVYDGGSSSHAVRCTDFEMIDNLSKDTCPAFVTDGSNRVVWVNEAYRRSITGEESSSSEEVVVFLVVEDSTVEMYCKYKAFTCKVRLEYTWRKTKYNKTVPCDVWKMEFGGYAWRLDTTAALTLWL